MSRDEQQQTPDVRSPRALANPRRLRLATAGPRSGTGEAAARRDPQSEAAAQAR